LTSKALIVTGGKFSFIGFGLLKLLKLLRKNAPSKALVYIRLKKVTDSNTPHYRQQHPPLPTATPPIQYSHLVSMGSRGFTDFCVLFIAHY